MTPPRDTPASSWVGGTARHPLGLWGDAPPPSPSLNLCLTDGELYSATFNNFLGTEPVILRNLGPHYSMKTEYLTSWLNGRVGGTQWGTARVLPTPGTVLPSPFHPSSSSAEPHFVASAYVQESAASSTGDDDKVYFFFSERAVEYDCYAEQVVARVARVCKVREGDNP